MQIFFFSKLWTLALCFIIWTIFQCLFAIICLKIPDRYFSPGSFLFKERKWEKGGLIYDNVFKIRKWKRFLPDGGAIVEGGYKKKHLIDFSKDSLEKFLIESCRAELVHLLCILPFWIFGLFAPLKIIIYMFIYALVVNFPCIIAQRYNRPRINKILRKSIYNC